MKKFKKICVAFALIFAFTSFFEQKEADALCYVVRYSYSFGDCLLSGDVYCAYCDQQST